MANGVQSSCPPSERGARATTFGNGDQLGQLLGREGQSGHSLARQDEGAGV